MDARDDPTYLRLYQEYAKAIQAFENATKDRRRMRSHLSVKRSPVLKALQEWNRRPVGSPRGTRIPVGNSGPRPAPPARPQPRQIYLGDILGWVKIVPTSPVIPEMEAGADADIDKLYDQMSLRFYWNAKRRYEECKRAFFDYVRRHNITLHKERAKDALGHGANLQLLGLDDSDDPEFMQEARREVEAACRNTWAIYQNSRTKNVEVKILLLEAIADAQYVGLSSSTVQAMTGELQGLIKSGNITKVK